VRLFASCSLAGLLIATSMASTLFAQTNVRTKAPTAAPMVAATPPMGWNSWNYFNRNVTDKDIRDSADQIVTTGMKAAGYVYVNIDDTWEGERDANGVLHSNSRFPDMKALAEYVHSKGLKIGIYSSPGPYTCAKFAGSYDHEEQDAQLYASWGIDFLKYDLCGLRHAVMEKQAPNDQPGQMRIMQESYIKMAKALKATGRPIVYSFCQYGWDAVWEWGPAAGANLWRTGGDIQPNWQSMALIGFSQAGLSRYAGPGHWNDPDMLEVGNGTLTLEENRTHFSLWAMLAAPLLAGNDLPHMKPEIQAILTNKDVIAIDQDRLGRQGDRAYIDGEIEVWTRPLADGAMAVAMFNMLNKGRYASHPFYLNIARLGLRGSQKGKDLWTGKDVELSDAQPIELGPHDVLLVRIPSPKK
jgi:alpha-galactosidase